jgi:hypothetical protein
VGPEQVRTTLTSHGNAPRSIEVAPMSVREPGAASLRGRASRAPVDRAALTQLSGTASRVIQIVAVFVVMAFAVVACAGSQEQGGREAAGGGDAAQPAREAKASRTDTAVPPMPADGNYDCADFKTRAQAKAVLERDPSDPHYLDGDGDRIPCEDLPPGEGYAADANSHSDSDNGPTTGPATAAGRHHRPRPKEYSRC